MQTPQKPAKRVDTRPTPRRIVGWCLQLALCVAVYAAAAHAFSAYVKQSPQFRVETVRVEGGQALADDIIIKQAGVTSGDNLLDVDPLVIQERIQELPYVSECNVERIFPDKIVYQIRERTAVATLVVDNHLYELDANGTVLCERAITEKHIGPLITEIQDIGAVEVGTQITNLTVQRALALWAAFSATSMAKQVTVSEISAIHETLLCMYCDELRCEIRWGRDNYEQQAWKLDVFWQDRDGRIPFKEYIDLRFSNDIACR